MISLCSQLCHTTPCLKLSAADTVLFRIACLFCRILARSNRGIVRQNHCESSPLEHVDPLAPHSLVILSCQRFDGVVALGRELDTLGGPAEPGLREGLMAWTDADAADAMLGSWSKLKSWSGETAAPGTQALTG